MVFKQVKTIILLLLLVSLLSGCTSIGPRSIVHDRFDYTAAVADSWKRQMLLNIVKLRYGDAPIFMEVASIINQYSQEGELIAGLGWSFPPAANNQSLGAVGRYYDRPTISYNLLTGEKFARSLMTPISPTAVMSLVEGGYPIDLVFRILVHSINGIRNQYGGSSRVRLADPEFFPLLEKLRHIQNSGAASMRLKKVEGLDTMVMIFRKRTDLETEQIGRDVRNTLGLNAESGEFRVVYGSASRGDDEIAILTRSIIEILSDISSTVEVSTEHLAEKRVTPTMEPSGKGIKDNLIKIHCTKGRPVDDFAAVPYRDHWFWIDDRDYQSKKLFSFLMFVMTLTETGGKDGAPVVTISAGG